MVGSAQNHKRKLSKTEVEIKETAVFNGRQTKNPNKEKIKYMRVGHGKRDHQEGRLKTWGN